MSQETKTIRPNYYNTDSIYEPIKIIQHYGLNFESSNCLKYILRAGVKNKATEQEDLIKAITYLQLRVDWLESQKQGVEVINDTLSPNIEEAKESDIVDYKKEYYKAIEAFSKYSRNTPEECIKLVDSITDSEDAPKEISSLKVGDKIKAIDPCYMNSDKTDLSSLTINKWYDLTYVSDYSIKVTDDDGHEHSFSKETLSEFFHVINTPVLTPENIKSIQDENYNEELRKPYH